MQRAAGAALAPASRRVGRGQPGGAALGAAGAAGVATGERGGVCPVGLAGGLAGGWFGS